MVWKGGKVWMRTSDSCLSPRGFTLLELLVVIGIIAVVSAVTFPGLVRLYQSVSNRVELDDIVSDINLLGRRSFESGRSYSLTGSSQILPQGWRLEVPDAIHFSASGACRGGSISFVKNDTLKLRVKLDPPFCQITDEAR